MTAIDLRLGPLQADGYVIQRSGVRWLFESGQHCRAGQVFAYCNINLEPAAGRLSGPPPFAEEMELQVAFAARVSGRVFINPSAVHGGYLSVRSIDLWNPDAVLASIEPDETPADGVDSSRLRLLMLAGRRMTNLADAHTGLLPGWHGRKRGWWCEKGETPQTLLSLGICDVTGVVIGEQCAFFEMFEAMPTAAQVVYVPDHPLAPTAPTLLDQLQRTPAQFEAISSDLREFFANSASAPSADDWTFAGALLSVMQQNPIKDSYNIFSANGSARTSPADAVLLSLNAEPQSILRHRKLGYHVHVMRHHQSAAGPAIRSWLASAFEPVRRSVADIKRDYEALIDRIAETTGGEVIIMNRMSTSGYEDISSYMPFDAPLSNTLANVASKELNLMLEDIAERRSLSIIDVDAIAADIGGGDHLPDGIHQSGALQTLLRSELQSVMNSLQATELPRAAVR